MTDQPTNADLQRQIEALSLEVAELKREAAEDRRFRDEIAGGRKVVIYIFASVGWLVLTGVAIWQAAKN